MQGKLDQAVQVATKMLTAYPTDTLYLTELALAEVAQGNLESARRHFGDVLVLDPENPTAKAYLSAAEGTPSG